MIILVKNRNQSENFGVPKHEHL